MAKASRKPSRQTSTEPKRRRRAHSLAVILAAAKKSGFGVRGLRVGTDGAIDIDFGKPAEEQPEDLEKLV
jgi:hypothetical protein